MNERPSTTWGRKNSKEKRLKTSTKNSVSFKVGRENKTRFQNEKCGETSYELRKKGGAPGISYRGDLGGGKAGEISALTTVL